MFLGCLYTGILMGILYDLLALLRLPFRGALAAGLFDACFYMAITPIAAFTLLYLNDGRIRLYTLCAMALGAALYRRFPSRLLRAGVRGVRRWFGRGK